MIREIDIAWLAGIVDGEGCFHFAARKSKLTFIDCWLQVGMCHKETVDRVARLMSTLSEYKVCARFRRPYADPHGYARRDQWIAAVYQKRAMLRITRALLPYLVTKQLEARLVISFLERSISSGKYKATVLDRAMAEVAQKLKLGRGEAPAEANQLLGEVIPNQATVGKVAVEGLQTRSVSPNNNPTHECPTPSSEGGDIVDSSVKAEGFGIKSPKGSKKSPALLQN